MDYLEDWIRNNSSSYSALTKRDKIGLMRQWRQIYAGDAVLDGIDARAFTVGKAKSIKGAAAEVEFVKEAPASIYVIPSDDSHGYVCQSAPADLVFRDVPCGLLLYVFDEAQTWTMVFSYDCCGGAWGPFFSRREWGPAAP
jgi:hypothetical protein